TAWVGPIPHSVDQDAALEHLKRKYKSTAIAGEQLVNGSRFYRAIFGNQQDMASAIDQSPRFFRGQFLHVVGDVQEWASELTEKDVL
ncbi:hypothetical protein BCR44DRAFT_1456285, partial [Catenaria anguillulae PL171]